MFEYGLLSAVSSHNLSYESFEPLIKCIFKKWSTFWSSFPPKGVMRDSAYFCLFMSPVTVYPLTDLIWIYLTGTRVHLAFLHKHYDQDNSQFPTIKPQEV